MKSKNNDSETICFRSGMYYDSYNYASLFLREKGKILSFSDIVKERLNSNITDTIWTENFTTTTMQVVVKNENNDLVVFYLELDDILDYIGITYNVFFDTLFDSKKYHSSGLTIKKSILLALLDKKKSDSCFFEKVLTDWYPNCLDRLSLKFNTLAKTCLGEDLFKEYFDFINSVPDGYFRFGADDYNFFLKENIVKSIQMKELENIDIDFEEFGLCNFLNIGKFSRRSPIYHGIKQSSCPSFLASKLREPLNLDKIFLYEQGQYKKNLGRLFLNCDTRYPKGKIYRIGIQDGDYYYSFYRKEFSLKKPNDGEPQFQLVIRNRFKIKEITVSIKSYLNEILKEKPNRNANAFRVFECKNISSDKVTIRFQFYSADVLTRYRIPREREIISSKKLLRKVVN